MSRIMGCDLCGEEKTKNKLDKFIFRQQTFAVTESAPVKLEQHHGRNVYKRELICADCYAPAKFLIEELDGRIWFYCGVCEIGG